MKRPVDLLIKNAYVVSMDEERRVFPHGAVAVAGARIDSVGPERQVVAAVEPALTIDAHGAPVHPGFVETHVHLMHVIRGAYPDIIRNYGDAVDRYTRWWDALEDEDEHVGCLLACLELVRNGTTCFAESGTVFEPDTAAAAAIAVGLRGLLADPFLWDRTAMPPVDRAPARLERCLDQLGGQLARNADPEALVRGYVSIYGVGTASDELHVAAKACADANGALFAQHQSFNMGDVADDTQRFGAHPLVHYDRLGTVDENCLYFHVNFAQPDEVETLVRGRASVAWCPAASMISGNGGTAEGPHVELYKRGVNVALGSDSATQGHRFDVGLQGFLAILSARERSRDRQVLHAEDALEMATRNGAKALGLADEIGSLEPGKRADIVVRSLDLPEANPGVDVAQSLIFAAGAKSVDTVIVNGDVVVRGGRSTRVDEADAYERARASSLRMRRRLGIVRESRWPVVE